MFDFIIAERKSKCKLIIRHYLNIVAAMARTVELAEVHALPDAEDGLARRKECMEQLGLSGIPQGIGLPAGRDALLPEEAGLTL